jgi:DNA-binding winged helix-turn-helix (wHTH) protein/tetratricopeptide (TPR) repeat protein
MSASKSFIGKHLFTFGPYRLRARERVLEKDGRPIAIPEKTLDVLCVLLENRGQLVEKETLMRKVWPDTFVEDSNIAFQISTLRKLLDESANAPKFIATVPKRGYRFIAEVREELEPEPLFEMAVQEPGPPPDLPAFRPKRAPSSRWLIAGIGASGLALIVGVFVITGPPARSVTALTEKGTIVLSDFENKTGDAIFDGTLRQGLLVELEQSPFLSLLSEQRVRRTLSLMRQPAATRLTHDLAMAICQRTNSTLLVEGSIERVGQLYVLGLRAISCDAGSLVAAEQAKAQSKERVLDALSGMAARFRARVGENAATLQRHNTTLAEATTASAEALKAYSTGWTLHSTRGAGEAIPSLRHAVELDPEFAMAHAALGRMYADIDESDLSAESLRKAWDLREHASDRERFFIATNYLGLVTGNLEETRKLAKAWVQTYPRDALPHTLLSGLPNKVAGRYEEAASQARIAIQMDPDFGMSYYNLAVNNQYLERFDAAASALAAAQKRELDIEEFQMIEYDLAFLRHDTDGIEQMVARARQRPAPESWLANREAFRLAYAGRLRQAREISARAIAEAKQADERERAGLWEAGVAVREALTGNMPQARRSAAAALLFSNDREVAYGAGLALALAGDSAKAQMIVSDLQRRFPEDTSVRFTYLPVMQAQIEVNHHNPSEAIEVLKTAAATEMGVSRCPVDTLFGALYPIYFRGLALSALRRGAEAAAEFQKLIDHSGIVVSDPVGALAHLQLARAYRIANDTAKAKSAYEGFFQLWKDADAEIPLLRAARAEYKSLTRLTTTR